MIRKVLRPLLVVLLCSFVLQGYGQQAVTDSLSKVLAAHRQNDTMKVDLLVRLANGYQYNKPDLALVTAFKSYALAGQLRDTKTEVKALGCVIKIFTQSGQLDSAITYCRAMVDLGKKRNDLGAESRGYNAMSNAYFGLGKYGRAIECVDSCMQISVRTGDSVSIADCYIEYSSVYIEMAEYTKALTQLYMAQKIYERWNRPVGVIYCYMNIGQLYNRMEEYNKAIEYFNYELKAAREQEQMPSILTAYIDMGGAYIGLKRYPEALDCFDQAMEIAKKNNDEYSLNVARADIGIIYFDQGDLPKAYGYFKGALAAFRKLNVAEGALASSIYMGKIESQDKATARQGIARLEQALVQAAELHNRTAASQAAGYMAEIYEQRGDDAKALQYTKLYHRYEDSVNKENNTKQIQQLQFTYELDKKESRINVLEKDKQIAKERSRVKSYALVGLSAGVLLLIVFTTVLFKKNKLISAQKEEIQRHATELDELNSFKDTILSILSHDLRTPLSTLSALIQLMDLDMLDAEELPFFKEQVSKQLVSTDLLISNILQWASTSLNGNGKMQREELSIADLALQSIELLQVSANEKHLRIENNIPAQATVTADRNQVGTVIRNLLANAIKFTPEQGVITLSVRQAEHSVDISVADTGVGMSAEQVQQVFTRNKISTYGTNREKGIGLGLLLCKGFAEANGGSVAVHSELGKGSIFTITLPR